MVEPLLIVRRVLREQIVILHRRLLAIVREDEVCRRLMTTPGVGPVVALTYRATVDVPARFRKPKSVGAVFGLTCSRYQSGEIDWSGKISRYGDEMMRTMSQRQPRTKAGCPARPSTMCRSGSPTCSSPGRRRSGVRRSYKEKR
jgi:transposase